MAVRNREIKIKRIMALMLSLCLMLGMLAAAQPVRTAYAADEGTIIATSLYVRSGPGTTYSKMTVNGQDVLLNRNTKVEILGEKDGWYQINVVYEGKTVQGYVSGKYVEVKKAAAPTPTKAAGATAGTERTGFSVPARIWASEVNIRKAAGTSGALQDTLKSGASLTVIGEVYVGNDKWYKVSYKSGTETKEGYAFANYVTLNGTIPTAAPTSKATPTVKATPAAQATPTPAAGTGEYASQFEIPAKVTATELNVRSGAGTGNSVITMLKYGASVTATGVTKVGKDTWYRISFDYNGSRKVGYVFGQYLTLGAAIPTATPKPTATPIPTATKAPTATTAPEGALSDYRIPATVIATRLNVRPKPGTMEGNDPVAILISTAKVTALGSCMVGTDKWYCIEYAFNGKTSIGYVFGEYLQLSSAEPTKAPTKAPTATFTPTPTAEPTKAPTEAPAATPAPEATPTNAPESGAPTPAVTATPKPTKAPVDVEHEAFRYPAKISAYQLNMRKGPGTEYDVITLLNRGDSVVVVGEGWKGTNKWYRISLNGVDGYALSDYVKLDFAGTTEAVVTADVKLHIAAIESSAYAKTKAGAVIMLDAGTKVTLSKEQMTGENKWFEVSVTKDGEKLTGYMMAKDLKLGRPVEPTPTPVPTATPVPTPTVEPTKAPEATVAPTPEATVVPTQAPEATVAPTPEATVAPTQTPEATVTPTPEATIAPTQAPEATATPVPTPTAEPTKAPEATVAPTPTPEVTATPTPIPTPEATPAAEAKENTPGEQIGWAKSTITSSKGMTMKNLPIGDSSPVKMENNPDNAVVIRSDSYIKVYGLYVDTNGSLYRHVGVEYLGTEYYGYVLEKRLEMCDAPDNAGSEILHPAETPDQGGSGDTGEAGNGGTGQSSVAEFELMLLQQGFPESYKPLLRELHETHPTWVFNAYHTGLDWNTAIAEESIPGKNLIPNSYSVEWKSLEEGAYNWKTDKFIVYDGSTWVTASKAALEYYMDPRNFLDEKAVFQFEVLRYEPAYQNLEGIENILRYTPLYQTKYAYVDQNGIQQSISYGETFIKAAEYSGVSPYHLATRVKQEVITGATTVSNSVTGTVSGLEGLYNFYNIGAYHSTQPGGAIANGLKYAKYGSSSNDELNDASLIPWNNRYSAIVGGAYIIGSSYINRGQDTIYLQKFNMSKYYTYSHQYMANVVAPSSEGRKVAQAYTETGSPIVFSIPVFLNMPAQASPIPKQELNPNNYLASLSIQSVDGTNYAVTPSFNGMSTFTYSIIVPNSVEVININATAVSQKAVVGGTGYKGLEVGTNTISLYCLAENGIMKEYILYVVREE